MHFEKSQGDGWPETTGEEMPWDDGDGDGWLDEEPESDVEWGLPLGAENFRTGEPLVVADYFDLAPSALAEAAEKLSGLQGAVPDEGAHTPRVLIFDRCAGGQPLDIHRLIAIATLRGTTLRVETAREATADRVRDVVRIRLGPGARHRRRTMENPFDVR